MAHAILPAAGTAGRWSGWRQWLGRVAAAFLGGVLLVAAVAKALDPAAFAEQIVAEGLAPSALALPAALAALAVEAVLGFALLFGLRGIAILAPASALVAFFLSLTGRAWWRAARGLADPAASCGCFGNLLDRTPAEAFWGDLLLLLPALLIAWWGRPGAPPRGIAGLPRHPAVAAVATAVIATAGLVLFAWRAPALPLDNLATRLRPGVETSALCAGSKESRLCLDTLAPELDSGHSVVVLLDLEHPAVGETVEALNAYRLAERGPQLLVMADAALEAQHAFFWQFAPAFEVREIPRALLRPLYRRLPRSFVVEDGRVTRTFSGLPPFDELVATVASSQTESQP